MPFHVRLLGLCLVLTTLVACGTTPTAAPTTAPAAAVPTVVPATLAPTNAVSITPTTLAMTASSTDTPAAMQPTPAQGASTAAFPLTIQNCGFTTTYNAPPQRAVTMYPPTTEIMLALGLGSKIVGAAGTKAEPVQPQFEAEYQQLSSLSETYLVPKEVLLNAMPDFVFDNEGAASYNAENGYATREELAAAGANIYSLTARCPGDRTKATLEDLYTDILNIGKIFGINDRAEALVAEMRNDVSAAQARIANTTPLNVVIYDSGEGPLYVYGPGSISNVVALAGGTNVFGNGDEFPGLSPEEIAVRNPDVFLVIDYAGGKTAQEKTDYLVKTFPNTAAVKNGRIVVVPYRWVNAGVQNAQGVAQIAQLLFPEAFAGTTTSGATTN